MSVTVFGIRHHGPGCARSLLGALDALAPDVLLIEMPQEAEPLLVHAAHEAMKPPVALLICTPRRKQPARTLVRQPASRWDMLICNPGRQRIRHATESLAGTCFSVS